MGGQMTKYLYVCPDCSKEYQLYESITDNPSTKCMFCGKKNIYRKLFPPNIKYNGSGFHSTDYS